MRRKIKELMNKEDGFTLVELLAVIVILGIIVAIAIPSIGGIIGNTKTSADKAEEALVEDAGRLYFSTSGNTGKTEVTVSTLVKEGYLEDRTSTDNPLPTGGVKKENSKEDGSKAVKYTYSDAVTADK